MRAVGKLLLIDFVTVLVMLIVNYMTPIDFAVDPEYLNGILTASSILFGFWIFFLGTMTQAGERVGKNAEYKGYIKSYVFFSFALLVASIFAIYFGALNLIPSIHALLFCASSFMHNLTVVLITFHRFFSIVP